MEKHRQFLQEMHEDHRSDYHDAINAYCNANPSEPRGQFPDFPSFVDWVGRKGGVPDGQQCRDLYSASHYMKGSAGPHRSRHEYFTQQLQNVPCTGTLWHLMPPI